MSTSHKWLRPKKGAEHIGRSLSGFWLLWKQDPEFPRGVLLSPRCRVFDSTELDAYVARKAGAAR